MYTVLYTVLAVKRKIEVKEVPASAFEDYRLGRRARLASLRRLLLEVTSVRS
jgi:hypothetical protein